MTPVMRAALTMVCALLAGELLDRLRVPGGMMVGAVIGACALNVVTGKAAMPEFSKTAAQIVAGAFIGSGISREELRQMKAIIKPALVLLPGLLIVNILIGLGIHWTTKIDFLTALLSSAPGGMTDISIMASDMGADASVVLVLQFVRLMMGIGLFPIMIRLTAGCGNDVADVKSKGRGKMRAADVLLTLAVASVCGLIGKALPIPAGTISFATAGSCVLACTTGRAQVPALIRKGAQMLSGAYLGAGMGAAELLQLTHLGIPALILVSMYTLSCFVLGGLLTRMGCFTRTEGMLAATPAGASDMALISADLGVNNAGIIVLQVMRLLSVVLLFPSILSFVAHL